MKRGLLLLLLAGCASREPAPPPPPLAQQPVRARVTLEAAIADGVRWLVEHQRKGGNWGTGRAAWGFNLYARVPGSHMAFKVGTTALAAMACREAGTAESLAAAQRAELWLATDGADLRRADEDELYNVWGHLYAIQALAAAVAAETDPALLKTLRAGAAEHVDLMTRYESCYGGWMYYDFAVGAKTPAYPPTSFTTASALIAFRKAEDAGIEVPDVMVKRCVRIVEKCRLPSNAYLYAYGHRYRPQHPINHIKGSLARTTVCNEALMVWKSKLVDLDDVRKGLADLFTYQKFLEIARKRPIPHEAYYYNSGYFYYYGHYYAALHLDRFEGDERATWAGRLSDLIRSHQEEDGSWWDYNAVWDFDKPYGTAYALLTLLRCRTPDAPAR